MSTKKLTGWALLRQVATDKVVAAINEVTKLVLAVELARASDAVYVRLGRFNPHEHGLGCSTATLEERLEDARDEKQRWDECLRLLAIHHPGEQEDGEPCPTAITGG